MAARISATLSALVFAMLMANASATLFGLKCKLFWWKCRTPVVHNPVVVVNPPVIINPPASTCGRVDIPFTNQCTTASGGYCSRCLGKCCLDDGYCASTRCNDGHSDADYCYSTSIFHYKFAKYDKSNCLGNLGYSCSGWLGGNCPASIGHARAVCVPFNRDCGRSTSKWGLFHKFTFFQHSQACLGYISCPNGGCGDWHGATCIYQGHSKLSQVLNWCANDYEICSCPLQHSIWG